MPEKESAELSIIRLLKDAGGESVSGGDLSRLLGISRTAVWKHVKALRKAGYVVTACPSKGYSLSFEAKSSPMPFNAIEINSGLETAFVGKKIFFYPELDSTNAKAARLARDGADEGTVVIAGFQSAGKGRIGRKWESPAGVNLYTSIILRPGIAPFDAQKLTIVMAVAVAEAIEKYCKKRPVVKWPNDILIASKKVAGILMEMDAEADHVNFIVAGIGVNINMNLSEMPPDIRRIATSLSEAFGQEISRIEFTRTLYSCVEKWYKKFSENGFPFVLTAWRSFFASEGKRVIVKGFNRTVEGICAGVDATGALLLRVDSGKVERIISGDVDHAGGV